MASTRNKNTVGDYQLETRQNLLFLDSMLYKNSAWGVTETTHHAGDGVFAPRIPYTELAYNGVDIETNLRGIRMTDLTNPYKEEFIPQLKPLKSLSMYQKPGVVMPLPLVVETKQRPQIFN
jgi:hypothetical protein